LFRFTRKNIRKRKDFLAKLLIIKLIILPPAAPF